MENPTSPAPAAPSAKRVWLRRAAIAVSCAPLALISVVHTMGRTGDFGILGKWYVMVPLTIAGFLAWQLIEHTILRTTPAQQTD